MSGIGKDLVIGVDLDGVCADFYEPMRGLVADWRCVDVHELTRKVSHGYGSGVCLRHRLFISCFHRDAAEQTVAWLDYIAIPYRDLCFVADKSLVDADIYIEDAEKIIRHVHEGSMRDD